MDIKNYLKFLLLIILKLLTIKADIPLNGKYSDELISGNLVIPRKVNKFGEHLTHNLINYHNYDEDDDTKDLHYHIDLNNETLHLELEPHTYFMAPSMIIERHKRDLRTRRRSMQKNVNCHYHGKIRGHRNSKVAISACEGIVGHIKTKNAEYFIEPSKNHEISATDGSHPHVIFQRVSVKEKKKKNRHKSKKRHAVSNCGTKEPRRRTETRIEWQPQGKVIVQGGRKIRRHHHSHNHHNNNYNHHHQLHHNHHHNLQHHHQQQQQQQQHQKHQMQNQNFVQPNVDNNNERHRSINPQRTNVRLKRSISSPRHVETLIVADSTMINFHDNVELYLLTIMNMVSSLYKDPTIGNAIEIVVVKMILIEEDEAHPELNLNDNAQRNLDQFCMWQHKLNTMSEKDPHHHDAAVFITRQNICGSSCMTLGLANVGGMCKPRKSCSVNEDNGIMLSHTIAHELGHNFGMYHDTMKIGCHGRIGPIVHIMTPSFLADTLQVSWSNCSRKYITHFLDQGLGKCLDDKPSKLEYNYPDLPPGAMYNADLQCRLQFNITDEGKHVCSSTGELCSQLWCMVQGECVTNMRPAAPGTTCDKHKWCQNGQCVHMEELAPRNGGWGNWSDWSDCSRSCGGGVSIQQRECNNPIPSNGGLFCIGERKRYVICNKDPCPEGLPSFRAQQCSNFNNVTYQGETYKWLPYFDKYNPCKLFCTDAEDTVIANWGDTAADGTPCHIGTKNMCIDGICKKVSCDWIVDSNKEEDRCGICGGNNEGCEPVKGLFSDNFNTTDGYVEIVTIPAKARHIIIKEMSNSPHFLSIGKANSTKWYLNGGRQISLPGEFIIAGAESIYDREDNKETITIPRQIEHAIVLYAIVFARPENDGIYYEFTLPATTLVSVENFTWKYGDWTACTATCGGGHQYRMPLCFEGEKLHTDEELCWVNAGNSRPKQIIRECNEIPCPEYWWIGEWQNCPVTCKNPGTPHPVKIRSILCLDKDKVVQPDSRCNNETRPIAVESCGRAIPYCDLPDMTNDIDVLN